MTGRRQRQRAPRLLLALLALPAARGGSASAGAGGTSSLDCRDRLTHPFSAGSIWNTAVGSTADFAPARLYHPPPAPAPAPAPNSGSGSGSGGGGKADQCAAGKADPSSRRGCAGWQPAWAPADCLAHGCCYDPHPNPDPARTPWCFANASAPADPARFYVDVDYFVRAGPSDPLTPVLDQGWWGDDAECGRDHCCTRRGSAVTAALPFPRGWTVNMTSNNAAALLLPDNETLVQFQPLVRCAAGSPLMALTYFTNPTQWDNLTTNGSTVYNTSILGEGTWGAHGGSLLSSIGGTVRLGELLPAAPPLPHALKLMLWAERYYFPGSRGGGGGGGGGGGAAGAAAEVVVKPQPCFRWPALRCDGGASGSRDPSDPNFYNGTDPKLVPGALLAVPPSLAPALGAAMRTEVGARLLAALTDYGGYLDDNTASDSGAFNVEGGVKEELLEAYGVDLNRLVPPNGPSAPRTPSTDLFLDLRAVFQALHIVDNNGPTSKGGGGTPRRPPAAPICEL